jgi:hypothetical protein
MSTSTLSSQRGLLHLPTSFRTTLCILLLAGTSSLQAQSSQNKLDFAVTYAGERSLKSNTSQSFWMQGGSVELGANIWHGLGIAAGVTGAHASSIGTSGVPLSLVTVTFGPRYRWHADRRISIYAEGLIGEANGFRSLFPAKAGQQSEANGFASQVGGGIDYRLSNRFAIRALDAVWSRTQLPNSTDNVQNTLRLSAGIVLRFARQ